MTISATYTRAKTFLQRPRAWLFAALLAVCLALGWLSCRLNAGKAAMAELARLERAEKLQAQGEVTDLRLDARKMAQTLEGIGRRDVLLAAEVEDLRKKAADARPVVIIQGHGDGQARGNPIPASGGAAGTPPAACLLVNGSDVDATLNEGLFETKEGVHLFRGALHLARKDRVNGQVKLEPIIDMPIHAADIKLDKAFVRSLQATGWGYGPLVGARKGGWVAGVTILTPEVRLPFLDWPAGAIVQGAAGPGGAEGTASIYARPGVK